MRLLRAGIALFALAGCGKSEPVPVPAARAADLDPASVTETDVSGVIDAQRFTVREAWYRVERREGRRRVDVILSEGELGRLCKDEDVTHARHVWLRFNGIDTVAPGTYRGDSDADEDFSAHYEAHEEHGWTGRGGTAAVLIDAPPPLPEGSAPGATAEVVSGKLRACFGPGTEGCVAGLFRARRCLTEAELEGPFSNKPTFPDDAAERARIQKGRP
ncbi:MAG: hypothetical protein IT373_11795 [Polyangiaceae bacterium]|nr:hypothetical protein [Polyangiaceae bacterium]